MTRRLVAVLALVACAAACSDDRGGASTSTAPTTPPVIETTVPPTSTVPPTEPSVPVETTPSTTVPVPPGIELPPLVENDDGANDALTGVGRLSGQGSDCTAFLVDTGADDAPAFALTNGHCVGIFDSRTVIVDGPGGGVVAFNRFVDTDDVEVGVRSVRWATMRGVDLAVLELDQTVGALGDAGVAAYALRPFALEGTGIRVVGVPVTGIDPAEWFVRAADCAAGATTRLLEFSWVWDEAQANDCDAIVGGHSGSPVFDASGAVVGIINTTTVGAGPGGECYLGHPCEVTVAGARMVADTSYAIPVDGIAGCFTPLGDFDPTICTIEPAPPAATLSLERPVQQSPASWNASIVAGDGSSEPPSPGANVPIGLAGRAGPIGVTDCRDATGYTPTAPDTYAVGAPPAQEGFFVACLAPLVDGEVHTRAASYAVLQVDDTPPVVAPELSVIELGDERSIEPIFATPELSDYVLKVGTPAGTDCADPEGYVRYRRIPVRVGADERPASVCVIGFDLAENASEPARFELA